MKTHVSVVFLALCIMKSGLADDTQARITASRTAIKDFAGQLKAELKKGMADGGPTHAIAVCKNVASDIAEKTSARYDFQLARTSLKTRNPNNAPDTWERTVLETFEARKQAGEDPGSLEFHEITQEGGDQYFRYMKAIPTQGVCLACHGEEISPQVQAELDAQYPEDQARGFKLGDIRGAFTVKQRLE